MYVKVDGESVTEITLAELRAQYPNVSFPKGVIPASVLAQYDIYPTVNGGQPAINTMTHKVVPGEFVLHNGTWTRQYGFTALTAEEMAAQVSDKLDELAAERFQKETSGFLWTDGFGDTWWFSTTLEAQGKIEANRRTAESGLRPENGVWKCGQVTPDGVVVAFRPTSNAEIQAIGLAIHAFVQQCYTAEGNAVAKLLAGDSTASFQTEFDAL